MFNSEEKQHVTYGGSLNTYKPWKDLSMREKSEMMKVAIRNGVTDLADIRAKYNEFALGGNIYDGTTQQTQQMGRPRTRITPDGRTLHYSTVPATGEVRWIDFDDKKDFDGVTGYRFYDEEGNRMHYTPWQKEADYQKPSTTEEYTPTVEEADAYVRSRGYDPDLTRPLWGMRNMREEGLQGVSPEFDLLMGGRGLINGAVDALAGGVRSTLLNPYVEAGLTSYFGAHGLNHAFNEGIDGWGDAAMTALEVAPLGRVLRPMAGAGIDAATTASKYIRDNAIMPYYFSTSLEPQRIDAVNNAFRNQEWSNFLATRNGDNYYRLVNKAAERYSPNEKYFMSHTTPWEELSGMDRGVTDPAMLDNGRTINYYDRLYEFPTKTFGKMKSGGSHPDGGYSNYDVTEMGKNHLLFGETSSGHRDFVRVLSDKNAELLDMSPFTIGISKRPLKTNGFYDEYPVYEDIHMGNQTIVDGTTLNNAVQNTTYNLFERTPFGILRALHLGK